MMFESNNNSHDTTGQEIITLQMASEANRQTAQMIELLRRFKAEFDELQVDHQLLMEMIYHSGVAAKKSSRLTQKMF